MIYDERGTIDYEECGDGPTVVMVPGSCSTGAAWRPIMAQWRGRFRCVTTSLLGYGGTAERRTVLDTSIVREAEIVEAVIRRAGGPVHLVGHSFGGLTALAVALRKQVPVRSLAILEAPAPDILRSMGEHEHYRAFREMTDAYFIQFRSGNRGAIRRMIDFYGGAGTFEAWPSRVREYAAATTAVNILDWASAYGFRLTPAILATVDCPALVLWGADSHKAVQRANALVGHCTTASVVAMAGAAHFMIATHPQDTADVIARHVRRADSFSLARQGSNPSSAPRQPVPA